MRKIKGIQMIGINNIPSKNAPVGYLDEYYGKILNKDGSFMFYANFKIQGENDTDTKLAYETTGHYALEFREVPCDADGNILMVSHFLTSTDKYEIKISILCSKEPTHRINLQTGVITDNQSDGNYITNISLSYLVCEPHNITL